MDLTNELLKHLKLFEEEFGYPVPLRKIPSIVTEKELIDAIKESIKETKDIIPEKF